MKILLVEDDEPLAEMLTKALKSQHYLVDLATDGQAGWELVEAFEYDLILLDLMLPKLDGISFCKKLRQEGDRTPILLMTGEDSSTHKIIGLDAGADDYIVKPFDVQELLAQIRAVLRRGSSTAMPILEWGDLRLEPSKCEVTYSGQLIRLAAKEYALIELFLRHNQRIFSQSALLDHLWSFDEPPSENTVRAHIKSLRQKLKKAGAPVDFIETVYGLGYRLKSRSSQVAGTLTQQGAMPSTVGVSQAQRSGATIANQQGASGANLANQASLKEERVQAQSLNLAQPSRDKFGLNQAGSGMNRLSVQESETSDTSVITAPSAVVSDDIPALIMSELTSGIWERVKGKYSDRISVLEKTVKIWQEGTLSEELRKQALREAHLRTTFRSFTVVSAALLAPVSPPETGASKLPVF